MDKAKAGRHPHTHTDQARTSQREREQWKCSATTLVWTSALDELKTWTIPFGTVAGTAHTRARSARPVLGLLIAWKYIQRGLSLGRGTSRLPKGWDSTAPGRGCLHTCKRRAWLSSAVRASCLILTRGPGSSTVRRTREGQPNIFGYADLRRVAGRILGCRPKRLGSVPPTQSHLVRQWQRRESFAPLFGTVTQETAGFV